MHVLRLSISLALTAVLAAPVTAAPDSKDNQDSKKAEKLYEAKLCGSCHGEKGRKPISPVYPKLAGQNAAYLLLQYNDIVTGKRSNGQTALMKATLSSMKVSEAESQAIAEWLAQQ